MNFSPSIYYRKYSPLSTYPLLPPDSSDTRWWGCWAESASCQGIRKPRWRAVPAWFFLLRHYLSKNAAYFAAKIRKKRRIFCGKDTKKTPHHQIISFLSPDTSCSRRIYKPMSLLSYWWCSRWWRLSAGCCLPDKTLPQGGDSSIAAMRWKPG